MKPDVAEGPGMTGGQALVAQLIEEGVEDIFGIPGIQLDWAVDAIREQSNRIRFVLPRHEQATSYMADGYARTTGREGVFMVVPGPGILNALSGLATAYACNSRVLCIVGQIPSQMIGKGLGMLHEIPDQSGILKSLTKWHGIARKPEDIPGLVHEAFIQLRSGKPGPVALELPPDVLQGKGEAKILPRAPYNPTRPAQAAIAEAADILRKAKFPVIYAGGGAAASGAGTAIAALAERLQALVVTDENARGVIDDRHPLALPPLGGRAALPHADAILVLGSRFVDGMGKPTFAGEKADIIYVNLDPAGADAPRKPGLLIQADVAVTAEALAEALTDENRTSAADKADAIREWTRVQMDAINPQAEYRNAIRAAMDDTDILVSELTQVGYYSNVAFPVYGPRSYVTPGYQGTLGYGFNTALGASYGGAGRRVVSLNGDGGFGWGMQELATAARDRVDLSIVVFVDGHYGNVKRIQQRVFGANFAVDLQNPDFPRLAESFGLPFHAVESPSGLGEALSEAKERGGPALIAVYVGEMPSAWHLIHPFSAAPTPPPANPLGEPA